MNYTLKPSLEHVAVVKLAAILWNRYDIRDVMSKIKMSELLYNSEEIEEKWLKIEDGVKHKVTHLPIPELLKEKIRCFIKPVGFQILKWIEFNHMANLSLDLPQEFCWTCYGTLDKRRTAESLAKNESIGITIRYKLSCIYCLENSIWELWTKFREDCKSCSQYENQQKLVAFWTKVCMKRELAMMKNIRIPYGNGTSKREFNRRRSSYVYVFEHAAKDGNTVAVDYFYQKITSNEREKSLLLMAETVTLNHVFPPKILRENYSDILCFLFSKMNHKEQIEVFEVFQFHMLLCLLDWPWEIYFLPSIAWDFLPSELYNEILESITNKIIDGHKYFNYQEIFRKTWQQIPDVHKKNYFNVNPNTKVFVNLFKIRDEDNIKLLFPYATLPQKKRIMYHRSGQDICVDLIDSEEWGLLEYFIRECISSKDEMINFKNSILGWLNVGCDKKVLKCRQLLDAIIYDFDKRK